MIDVTFVRGSLQDHALAALADDLVSVLLRAEGAPDTAFMRENTLVYLRAVEPAAQLVGGRQAGRPRFRIDLTVFDGVLTKDGKEQLAADVHTVVCAAAAIDPQGPLAYHVWTLIHEIPEGNWAGAGKVVYRKHAEALTAEDHS